MIRTLIVDDESLARSRMRRMLSAFTDVKIIGEAENGADAVEKIETDKPELVLLDVQMPDLDGFGVLRMVEMRILPLVVFVTAFYKFGIFGLFVN
jgi:two-component system LytT family response regulator